MYDCHLLFGIVMAVVSASGEPSALTSLANPAVRYQVAQGPYVILKRGDVEAVVVDNQPVDDAVLPGHRAGYNGIASLKHARQRENLFVPAYAGLNFEYLHDGTAQPRDVIYEPRTAPMELRLVDSVTVELYQKPTPHFGLESCHRYRLLDNGAIEMVFECIPRKPSFRNGYVGLFWASYIHLPESPDIYFMGYPTDRAAEAGWIRGATPDHGVRSTHVACDDCRQFAHDPAFPFKLVFSVSSYCHSEPWYYGVSHGMALACLFRPCDQIRFTQSPGGGGEGNPAWDYQCFIPNYEVGKRYQMVMRVLYLPYESPKQIDRATHPHRRALENRLDAASSPLK